MTITAISFRPEGLTSNNGQSFTTTFPDFTLSLSTTSAVPGSASTTFSDNVGPSPVLVYNGPFTLSSAFSGPAGGPKDFDITIPLQTPYLYTPSQGNLLVDFAGTNLMLGSAIDTVLTPAGAGTQTGVVDEIMGGFGPIGFQAYSAPVTQFTVVSAVPEPLSALLVLSGLIVAVGVRRTGVCSSRRPQDKVAPCRLG